MNPMSVSTWEEVQSPIERIIVERFGKRLKAVEINLLYDTWQGLTYQKMAEERHLSIHYLRGDIGPKLWQKMSLALQEPVTKVNFKEILERLLKKEIASSSPVTNSSINSLASPDYPYPEGFIVNDSPFYIEREEIETFCFQSLLKPGALVHLYSSRWMGKTSLIMKVLNEMRSQNYQILYLDLRRVEGKIINNLDRFLHWLCLMISRHLQLDNCLQDYWNTDILGSIDNCSIYLENYLLPRLDRPLILAMDNLDRFFLTEEILQDIWAMLTNWHEKAKNCERWQYIHLILSYSTESSRFVDHQSDLLSLGIPVKLTDFNGMNLQTLLNCYHLQWPESEQRAFLSLIGGHPYLAGLGLYAIAKGKTDLKHLLEDTATINLIYGTYLRHYLKILQQFPDLAQSFKKVVTSTVPIQLDIMQAERLYNLGLIENRGHQVMPKCQLYRNYFR